MESAHTSMYEHCIHGIAGSAIKTASMNGCRAVNILRNSITIANRQAVQRERGGKKNSPINSPQMFAFFWICFMWNSHSSVQKLLEVGVIAAWDTVSLHFRLVQGGFYLWLKVNTCLTFWRRSSGCGSARARWRGRNAQIRTPNCGLMQVSCLFYFRD